MPDVNLASILGPLIPHLVAAVRRQTPPSSTPPITAAQMDRLRRHGLGGLLFHAASGESLRADPDAMLLLRNVTRAQELRAEQARVQIAELDVGLEAAGVQSVYVKGGVLAFHSYPFPSMRPFGDLDLVVRPGQREITCRTLKDLGYVWRSDAAGHSRGYLETNHYHLCYVRGTDIPIEVHWDVAPPSAGIRLPVEEVIDRRVKRKLGTSCQLHSPTAEDHLLILAVHAARHQFRLPLRNLFDVTALLSRHPEFDWAVLWSRADRAGAGLDLAALLGVVDGLGLTDVPVDSRKRISEYRLPIADLSHYALEWVDFDHPERVIQALSGPSAMARMKAVFARSSAPTMPADASVAEKRQPQQTRQPTSPMKRVGQRIKTIAVSSGRSELANIRAAAAIRRHFKNREAQ